MTTTHTPGPWSHYGDTATELRMRGPSPSQIEVCRIKHGGTPSAENVANARLIATAPDMLAASRTALSAIDAFLAATGRVCGVEAERRALIATGNELQAAITKATGEVK